MAVRKVRKFVMFVIFCCAVLVLYYQISGGGASRQISLSPLCLFSCEMRELLSSHPIPMPINKIVPAYKETFGNDFSVTRYGYPKLIKLLEAVPELIDVS